MGVFDGAEVCELVSIFILHKLSKTHAISDLGLYRDDGVAIFKNVNGPDSERIKKTPFNTNLNIRDCLKEHPKLICDNGTKLTLQMR